MLEVAYQLKSFRIFDGETEISTLDELFDHVAAILGRRVLDRARKGLYQRYLPYQDDLAHVRGRVSVGRSLVNYVRGSVALHCEFDDLTRDLEDNQILLWTLTAFDVEGSRNTSAFGIDKKGNVVGYYDDSKLVTHGFERRADGTMKTFEIRDASGVFPNSINEHMITGSYNDSNNVSHGFIKSQK